MEFLGRWTKPDSCGNLEFVFGDKTGGPLIGVDFAVFHGWVR